MKNPFESMSNASVNRPKTVFAFVMLVVLLLSSGAMHLQFDNSEDGFFPDDENVRLLEEIESEYQASIDFVRIIDEIESGDLLVNSTWERLAMIESAMIDDVNFAPHHYPLFGTQATVDWQAMPISGRCTKILLQPTGLKAFILHSAR